MGVVAMYCCDGPYERCLSRMSLQDEDEDNGYGDEEQNADNDERDEEP